MPKDIVKISDNDYNIEFNEHARVQIGGGNGSSFSPDVRIERWGSECWIRLKARIGYVGKTPTEVKDGSQKIIKLQVENSAKTERTDVYALDDEEGMEEGGLELEAIVYSKPTDGKVVWDYEDSENLDYLYQEPYSTATLSPEDDAVVVTRDDTGGWDSESNKVVDIPDWAIGSYAVYQKNRKILHNGAVETEKYKNGKVGHFRRPKLTDDESGQIWGELSIDTSKKTITVSAPDSFWDSATYPVKVDPTFGYTTIGAQQVSFEDTIIGRVANPGEAGEVSSIHAALHTTWDSGDYVKCALYVESSGALQSPQTEEKSSGHGTTAFVQFNVSGGTITVSDQDYVIATWTDNVVNLMRDTGISGDSQYENVTYGTWPSTASWTASANIYSTYATYSTGVSITSWENASGEVAFHFPGSTNKNIVGDGFLASQGSGWAKIGNASTYASVTQWVTLSIDSWANQNIQVDIPTNMGLVGTGQSWLYVENDNGERNASGFECDIDLLWGMRYDPASSYSVNWCRSMGGISPDVDGMTLEKVWLRVGATHSGQVRVAVYQGGTVGSGPPGATLTEDLGVTSGSDTNQWISIDSQSNPSLTKNVATWISIKCDDSDFDSRAAGTTDPGGHDFQAAEGRWISVDVSSNEATAYPSTWPSDTGGSFSDYWYGFYLEYSVGVDHLAAGTTDAVSTVVGTVLRARTTDGTVAAVSTAVATASVAREVSGTIDAVSTAAGSAVVAYDADGTIDAVSTVAATTSVAREVAGTIDAVSTVAATSSVAREVAGTIDAVSTVAATPSVAREVAGTIDAVSTVVGAVDVMGEVAGTVDAVSTVAATPSVAREVSGTIDAVSTVAATTSVAREVAGTIDAVSTVAATPSVAREVAGTIDAVSTVVGAVDVMGEVSGTVDAVSTVAATSSVAREVSGTIDAVSTAAATTSVARKAAGTIDAVSTVAATSSVAREVAGTIDAVSTVAATPSVAREVAGTIDAVSTVTGSVFIGSEVAGTIDAVSAVSGSAIVAYKAASTVDAVSTVDGVADVTGQMVGTVDAVSTVSGSAVVTYKVAGTINAVSTLEVIAGRLRNIAAAVDAVSTVAGAPDVKIVVSGIIDALSTVTATANVRVIALVEGIVRKRLLGELEGFQRELSALQEQMNEDLSDVFFDTDEFAEPTNCAYTHFKTGNVEYYPVIFDDPSQNVNFGSESDVTALKPIARIPFHLLKNFPDKRDIITIRGIDYTIDELDSDGVGTVIFNLIRRTSSYRQSVS
jgi:hypothetical protein